MKNCFVFGLLFLSSFMYLTNEAKQACETAIVRYYCGDLCLGYNKICRCGTSQDNTFQLQNSNKKFCCAPLGNCTKDNQGMWMVLHKVIKIQRVKEMLNLLRKWDLHRWYHPNRRNQVSHNLSCFGFKLCQTTLPNPICRSKMLSKRIC